MPKVQGYFKCKVMTFCPFNTQYATYPLSEGLLDRIALKVVKR